MLEMPVMGYHMQETPQWFDADSVLIMNWCPGPTSKSTRARSSHESALQTPNQYHSTPVWHLASSRSGAHWHLDAAKTGNIASYIGLQAWVLYHNNANANCGLVIVDVEKEKARPMSSSSLKRNLIAEAYQSSTVQPCRKAACQTCRMQ